MKKTIILLLLIFSAVTLFSEEQYDFRKVKWGMSFEEVLKSENINPKSSMKDEYISYNDSIFFKDHAEEKVCKLTKEEICKKFGINNFEII